MAIFGLNSREALDGEGFKTAAASDEARGDGASFGVRAATALTWVIVVSLLVLGFVWGNAFAYPAMLATILGLAVAGNSKRIFRVVATALDLGVPCQLCAFRHLHDRQCHYIP